MLSKVVSSVGTLSLVGSPMVCANLADGTQLKDEKLVNFLMEIVSSKEELSRDEMYNKLVDIFSVEGQGSLNIADFIIKFSRAYASRAPRLEDKYRIKRFSDVFEKFCSERFEKLDKNTEMVEKAKSLYKLKKSCVDAYVGDRSSELTDYFEKTLTEGDVHNVLDLVRGVIDGSYYSEDCATLDCASSNAIYEGFCSGYGSRKSVPFCDSFYDFASEAQKYFLHPSVADTLTRCIIEGKLKTGTTPAKPLNILVPESDKEYAELFKSKKVCSNTK